MEQVPINHETYALTRAVKPATDVADLEKRADNPRKAKVAASAEGIGMQPFK